MLPRIHDLACGGEYAEHCTCGQLPYHQGTKDCVRHQKAPGCTDQQSLYHIVKSDGIVWTAGDS